MLEALNISYMGLVTLGLLTLWVHESYDTNNKFRQYDIE